MNKPSLFKRAVKLFTFTDIPIRRKLFLFAGGGLGWFLIIALISFGAVTYVSSSYKKLTDEIVPQIKTGQKVVIKLRGANVSVHNIVIYDDIEAVSANIRRAKVLLDHVRTALKSLLEGGNIKDYSDLTGELIEEFHVRTISVGISEFPKDTENFWEAIKYADVALYKAKEAGRNKVLRFTKEMWTEEES